MADRKDLYIYILRDHMPGSGHLTRFSARIVIPKFLGVDVDLYRVREGLWCWL